MSPLCLHIGLSKAASTTLQKNVFRKHPDVFYLGKKQEDPELEEVTYALKHNPNSDRLPPDWAQTIQNRIRKGQDQNLIPLYSEEDLSTYKFIDPHIYIKRWYAIAPDARILFIIRNPAQWLTSLFFFRLMYGQDDVLLGFETWVEKFVRRNQIKSSSREVFYSDIYHLYRQAFTKDNILALPLELIKKDAAVFCDKVGAHFDVSSKALQELLTSAPDMKKRIDARKSFFAFQVFTHLKNGEVSRALDLINEIDQDFTKTVEHLLNRNETVRWVIGGFMNKTDVAKFSHYPRLAISLPVNALWSLQTYNEKLHQTIADNIDIDMTALGYKLPEKTAFTFLPDKKPIEVVETIPSSRDFDRIHLSHAKDRKDLHIPSPMVFGPRHPAMQDITVEEPDVFIINGCNLFWSSNTPVNIRRDPPPLDLEESDKYTHVPGHSLVLWTKGANLYSHWMFDLYPKLHLITDQSDFALEQFDHVLGNKGPSPVNQVLLGEHDLLNKYMRIKNNTYLFEQVTYITPVRKSSWTPDWIIEHWRGKVLAKADKTTSSRRIYLSRAKAKSRKLVNEQEIRPLLDKAGFEEVLCEDLNLYEAANILSNAEVVMGLHGAALANLIFCRPGTTVIELFGWHYMREFWFMAETCSLNYAAVSCRGPDKQPINWSDLKRNYSHEEINAADIYISPDHLETSFKSLGIL